MCVVVMREGSPELDVGEIGGCGSGWQAPAEKMPGLPLRRDQCWPAVGGLQPVGTPAGLPPAPRSATHP
jgi:hypothetical protein